MLKNKTYVSIKKITKKNDKVNSKRYSKNDSNFDQLKMIG